MDSSIPYFGVSVFHLFVNRLAHLPVVYFFAGPGRHGSQVRFAPHTSLFQRFHIADKFDHPSAGSFFSNLPSEAGVTYRICWNRDFQTPEDCETYLAEALQTNPKKTVRSILAGILPASLAAFLCDAANIDQHTNISSLKKTDRGTLIRLMTAYELDIGRNEGFAKAEVTSGGVPLQELDLATMELRTIPGVHIIGELVDVHGRIGGFNFLLAWIEGRLAGRAVAK